MRITCKSLKYKIRFDGDLLLCKPRKLFPYASPVEIPLNIVLDYQYKPFLSMKRLVLHINKYTHGQKRPVVRLLAPIYLTGNSAKTNELLLQALDQVILDNLNGSNIGLFHMPVETLTSFYYERVKRNKQPHLASMRIVYSAQQRNAEQGARVLELPQPHHMAS